MNTYNLCFEQKYQNFYLKIFLDLAVKFSIYLNRRIFVMLFTVGASLISNYFKLKILRKIMFKPAFKKSS